MNSHAPRTFVIVGGGLAAAEAAKTLRAEGFDDRLVLVAAESRLPYERPPLSKDYLRGETTPESLLAQPATFYDQQQVEVLTGRRGTRIDPPARRLWLDDGGSIRFDRLLLATGAAPRRLAGAAELPPWAHVLRTVEDADRLHAAARQAELAVVVGGGWIAAETAASLRQLGLGVTLAVPGREPLERSLGAELAASYGELHRRHGVRVVAGARAVGLADGDAGRGVRLASGRVLAADLVVLGLGAVPDVELARDAGLPTGEGVLVDASLETAAPGIHAAGDVADAWHPRYAERVRSEHWDNARRQGRTAARNMLGRNEPYDRIPYAYSDQFERGMEMLGRPSSGERVVIRQEPGPDSFVALWLRGGRAVAGLHANVWPAKAVIERLVSDAAPVDVDRFRDPSVPLEEAVAAAT